MKDKNAADRQIPVSKNPQFNNRMFIGQFPPDKKIETEKRNNRQHGNQGTIEPILFLTFFQDKLQGSYRYNQQGNTQPVNIPGRSFLRISGFLQIEWSATWQ